MRSTFMYCVASALGCLVLCADARAQQNNNQPTSKVDQRVWQTNWRVKDVNFRVNDPTYRGTRQLNPVPTTTTWYPPVVAYPSPYLSPWGPVSPWAPVSPWGPVSPWAPVYPMGAYGMYPPGAFGPAFGPFMGGFNSNNYWGGFGGGGLGGFGLPGTMPFGTGFGVY